MIKKKITFIGAGNMAYACINGFVSNGVISACDLAVFDIDKSKFDNYKHLNVNVFDSLKDAVDFGDYIILAVKPQVIESCLIDISKIESVISKTFISFAAGISTSFILKCLDVDVPAIRMMPNTPFLVGKGTVAISKNDFVSKSSFQYICTLFASISSVTVLPEYKMNSVISLNGSSPAYFFIMYKSMFDCAISQGFSEKEARELILSTMIGSAEMLRSSFDVDQLIKNVTSPNGTTEASIKVLEKYNFSSIIEECMNACTKRANELSKN